MLSFNDNKAGMTGLDKQKITKVIEENSSAGFSSFSKKKQSRVQKRTQEIHYKIETATNFEKARAEKEMKILEAELETQRDLTRHCVCIDMDAYFAAVEMRDDPKLRKVPMAVGSLSMLSTSNYLARRYGVRAGMPGFIAKKLCPNLVLVDVNFRQYSKISKKIANIFAEYDPDLAMMSLDEAYIDLTEYVEERTEKRKLKRKRYGGECECFLPVYEETEKPDQEIERSKETCEKCQKIRIVYIDEVEFGIGREEIVREIRFRVEQTTGLTCSAGIASSFMLAKICSDFNKPNGQFVLENDRQKILDFLKDLPIRKVNGIGSVSEAHLQACGINTVGEMYERRAILPIVFSQLAQESFLRTSLGLSSRPSSSDSKRKSVSNERTFTPTSDFVLLSAEHEEVCKLLDNHLRKAGVVGGKTITLKLKLASFDVLTRSFTPTSGNVISTLEEIRSYSLELLEKEKGQTIRLLGVRLSQLVFEYDEDEAKKNTGVKKITEFWNDAKRKKECSSSAEIDEIEEMRPCPICGIPLENQMNIVNEHVDVCILKFSHNEIESPELICVSSVESTVRKNAGSAMKSMKTVKGGKKRKRQPVTVDMFFQKL